MPRTPVPIRSPNCGLSPPPNTWDPDVTRVPNVLHVTAPAEFGGLERVVSALARGMRARGHGVHVLAFLDSGVKAHPLMSELTAAGVPASGIEVAPRAYAVERAAVTRVARETGARVVHTHGARVDVVDGSAARGLGLATVSTLHGFTGGSWKNRFYEWLQVRAVRRCDAVVAVSRPMAARLRASGVRPQRIHVIPNAWSPRGQSLPRAAARAALGLPAEGFRIGWVGRMTVEKGADVLCQGLAFLQDLPVKASFVGDGRQQETLRARAREMGLDPHITWHGPVPDAERVLAAFDVLVLSSRTEGTPILLFEAMAAGIPIVTTAVGGIPDVVTECEALLGPPERPEALAHAIRKVFTDREGAEMRARAASAVLGARFGIDPWLDAYEDLYEMVGSGVRPMEKS